MGRRPGPRGRPRGGPRRGRGERREPGRPAATAGPLPSPTRAPARSSDSNVRARSSRSATASKDGGSVTRVRAARGRWIRAAGRRPSRTTPARAERDGADHGRLAAGGGLHGVVQRRHARTPHRGRDAAGPRRRGRHRHPRHPGGEALGATVAVTAGSDERAQRCRHLGADIAINYREQDFVEVIESRSRRRRRHPRQHGRQVPGP